MPRKVLITKDTLQEILAKYQGGGSSGGSGTSTTEFHAENGLIQMKGVYTAGGLDYTISSYISGKDLLTFVLAMKQASPLFRDLPVTQDTTTAELVEILQNAMDSVDQNVLASLGYYFLEAGFGISIDQAGFGVNGEGVSSLYFDDTGTFPNGDAYAYYSYKGGQKQLLFYAKDVTNATFELNELTSGEITISGGSSSSGSSTALYKHSIQLMIYDDIEPIATTFTFLSKYAEPFVSNGSLLDMFNNIVAKNDEQIMITPYLHQPNYDAYAIANIVPKDTTGIAFTIARATGLSDGVVVATWAAFTDNATGITDTVEPYIEVSGSGSSESTGMQVWDFIFGVDESFQVYTKFTQSDLSTMLTDTNTSIDTINTMMGISLNHISSFNDIGTLITQSQTIDSTGALTETLIATFMSGLCSDKKTINVLQSDMFVRRTVVNCYPTITNRMATNYNCVVINNQNQFVTIQIDGTNASAGYEEI